MGRTGRKGLIMTMFMIYQLTDFILLQHVLRSGNTTVDLSVDLIYCEMISLFMLITGAKSERLKKVIDPKTRADNKVLLIIGAVITGIFFGFGQLTYLQSIPASNSLMLVTASTVIVAPLSALYDLLVGEISWKELILSLTLPIASAVLLAGNITTLVGPALTLLAARAACNATGEIMEKIAVKYGNSLNLAVWKQVPITIIAVGGAGWISKDYLPQLIEYCFNLQTISLAFLPVLIIVGAYNLGMSLKAAEKRDTPLSELVLLLTTTVPGSLVLGGLINTMIPGFLPTTQNFILCLASFAIAVALLFLLRRNKKKKQKEVEEKY